MHQTTRDLGKLHEVKEDLMGLFEKLVCQMKTEPECVDIKEAGELADMIKDLSEASEKCMKQKYYEMLICDMMGTDEDMEQVGRMGYDHWRYKSSGHYAPKGRGEYSAHIGAMHGGRHGYIPDPDHWEDERMPGRHIHAPYYYDADMKPMGYPMDPKMNAEMMKIDHDMRHGEAYNRYKGAKRHYTESHDETHKMEMNQHIAESAKDSIMAMKDMWQDASPETRKSMKNALEGLLTEMKG